MVETDRSLENARARAEITLAAWTTFSAITPYMPSGARDRRRALCTAEKVLDTPM